MMIPLHNISKKNIVLAPFCANSVLMYHMLKSQGVRIANFFDRNPLLKGTQYGDIFIQEAYWRKDAVVIVCMGKDDPDAPYGSSNRCAVINNEIKNTMLSLGYAEDDIFFMEDIEMPDGKYDASLDVDLEVFVRLMPAQMLKGDNSGYLMIRKLRKLKQLGAPKPGLCYEDFDGMHRKDNYVDENGEPHIFIKRIELDVTSRCTLRCKNCGALMPYFKSPRDIPIEQVMADYDRMMELIDWTDDILIMGGEPFINKDLAKLFEHIKSSPQTQNKVGCVVIVTNGTLIPDEKTLDVLKDSNIVVWISNYREHSRRLPELVDVLSAYHIRHSVLDIPFWVLTQQLVKRDNSLTHDELVERRKKCWKRHHAVSEGKFFLCAFSNFAEKLGAVPREAGNFVDIYDADAKNKIIEYLSPERALPKGCSWCSGNFPEIWMNNRIPVAEQTKEVLPYHKFT